MNKFKIKKSNIHGKGLFAEGQVYPVTVIGKLFEEDEDGTIEQTMFTKYINHSEKFNVQPLLENGEIIFYSTTKINHGEEILMDYAHLHEIGLVDSWYLSKIMQLLVRGEFKQELEKLIES